MISITIIIAVVSVVSEALILSLKMCIIKIKNWKQGVQITPVAQIKTHPPRQFVGRNASLISLSFDENAHVDRNIYKHRSPGTMAS
jgi:hypothetical protein